MNTLIIQSIINSHNTSSETVKNVATVFCTLQDMFLIISQSKVVNEDVDNNDNERRYYYDVRFCPAPCKTGTFLNVATLNESGHTINGTVPSIPAHFTSFEVRHIIFSNSLVIILDPPSSTESMKITV